MSDSLRHHVLKPARLVPRIFLLGEPGKNTGVGCQENDLKTVRIGFFDVIELNPQDTHELTGCVCERLFVNKIIN